MRQDVSDRAMDTPSDETLFLVALGCMAIAFGALGVGWWLLSLIVGR